MKSYYCFVQNFGKLLPGSFVYHVSVGVSQREQTKLSLVENYCRDCGIYFKKWSALVDDAIELAGQPFKACKGYSGKPFIHTYVSITELYEMIIDDSFTTYERNYVPSQSELWCSFRNLPTFIAQMNHKKCITSCQPHRRKYLSPAYRDLIFGGNLAIGFLFLLLLADFICNHISQLI